MIIVFKIVTGEDIIGTVNLPDGSNLGDMDPIDIVDPMYIVEMEGGGMKLRDACMLAADDILSVDPNSVVSYYYPSAAFIEYYNKASHYARTFTRDVINNQIIASVYDLEEQMKEDQRSAERISDILMKITGSTLQ